MDEEVTLNHCKSFWNIGSSVHLHLHGVRLQIGRDDIGALVVVPGGSCEGVVYDTYGHFSDSDVQKTDSVTRMAMCS